jgi:hypothetical protein
MVLLFFIFKLVIDLVFIVISPFLVIFLSVLRMLGTDWEIK